MKQYLNSEQTAKLIELGFEKPKSISGYYQRGPYEYDAENNTKMVVYDDTQYPIYAYSIGELIEMLPPIIVWKRKNLASTIARTTFNSFVSYAELDGTPHIVVNSAELIDTLYDMVVKLKEEEVI
jgi:hypothetical protein